MSEKHDQPRPRLNQRVPSGPRPHPLNTRQRTRTSSSNDASVTAAPLSHSDRDEPQILAESPVLTSSPTGSPPEASSQANDPFIEPVTPNRAIRKQASLPALSAITPTSSPVKPNQHAKSPTSTSILSPKSKPKPLRLNTSNLLPTPSTSPKKAISPSLKHWQQVRSHVLTTPAEEKTSTGVKGSKGIVGKAAAKLGFKAVADNVMGNDDRRSKSLPAGPSAMDGLSEAEKEEIARERRKFARDVKRCLDECTQEETRRRLGVVLPTAAGSLAPSGSSVLHSTTRADFSAFAPLLTELHKYLPAARARKPWCRTCPHHATILAELSTAFLSTSNASVGERQQALEVFGVIVRSWAADTADEELARWVWLCRALRVGDRQLRTRGLTLLSSFLHRDPIFPAPPEYPSSALAFQSLAIALFGLLHAVDESPYDATDHRRTVTALLNDLREGSIISLDVETVRSLIGLRDMEVSGGVEKDLLWLALGHSARSPEFCGWLFAPDNPTILRFTPPPILHATPPIILNLRARSAATFLTSLSTAMPSLPDHGIRRMYDTVYDLIIRDVRQLADPDIRLADRLGTFIASTCVHSITGTPNSQQDPFCESNTKAHVADWCHIALERTISLGVEWAMAVEKVLTGIVRDIGLDQGLCVMESFLDAKSIKRFAQPVLDSLLERITSSPKDAAEARPFLLRLRLSHPQLFYRPLFSLAASSKPNIALEHLRTVHVLTGAVGRDTFWLKADPRMIEVLLVGNTFPSDTEGEVKAIKIGRYAVLVEFLMALDEVDTTKKADARLKSFIEGIETRLGAALTAGEPFEELPNMYRALICNLFCRVRLITKSSKKASWQRSILRSYLRSATEQPTSTLAEPPSDLMDLYRALRAPTASPAVKIVDKRKSTVGSFDPSLHLPIIGPEDPKYRYLRPKPLSTLIDTMVLLQACWTTDDWGDILPVTWNLLGTSDILVVPLLFLLNKCGEIVPAQSRALLESHLRHLNSVSRSAAMRKIATAYAYRHQILSLDVVTSHKGPIFRFSQPNLDFVLTEIGSSQWSAQQDVKQEALHKYGGNLPLETKQRLMDLGWSDSEGLQASSGNWAEPISSLPIPQLFNSAQGKKNKESDLKRSSSTGSPSDDGSGSKSTRAVFAPVFWEVVVHQAIQAFQSDGVTAFIALELTRMLQRDEPTSFIRPLAAHFAVDFRGALALLNAVTLRSTPGFAYVAMNAVVGYLKHSIRHGLDPSDYACALTTIAILIPHVPEVSLRDIRKNKAEHALLPAAIQEEQGGFKVHAPWRDGQVDIQAAQLQILTAVIKANPADVHIVKRMLNNLQAQTCLSDCTFSRAWLVLVISLFGIVNRNYNDRAELRHFLTLTTVLLQTHRSDLPVVSHSIRFFMLCSARFRRLFAGMGFQTVSAALLDIYSTGNSATRDGIEHAMRSFYRIHQDSSVYHICLAIAGTTVDPEAVYKMLASLATPPSADSGISSGLKGLNDKEELDALIQMLSGPEIALSEIGKDRAERQATKLAQAAFASRIFPKEDIVRLFVTVIAANPPSLSGINMMKLFVGMVPFIVDDSGRKLLEDGVEALGGIISRERIDSAASTAILRDDNLGGQADWSAAKAEYIRLVEAWTSSGGRISVECTKTVFDMVDGSVRAGYVEVYPVAANILRSLTRTNLDSARPADYLRATARVFASVCGVLDISGILQAMIEWIQRRKHDIDLDVADIVIDQYLRIAMRYIIVDSQADRSGDIRLEESVVSLLAICSDLPVDAVAIIEQESVSVDLLYRILLPFVLSVNTAPVTIDDRKRTSMWIRLLNYAVKSTLTTQGSLREKALNQTLCIQVIKVIVIRAPEAISSVDGGWQHLARHLSRVIGDTTGLNGAMTLRDHIVWCLYQLLALHRSPLILHFRSRIEKDLRSLRDQGLDCRPGVPSSPSAALSPSHRRLVVPSLSARRIPSFSLRGSSVSPDIRQYTTQSGEIVNDFMPEIRQSSFGKSHDTSPGSTFFRDRTASRPTFTDLSLRHSSHANPAHPTGREAAPGVRHRFPSSAAVKRIDVVQGRGSRGGAIVHLLGTSNQVLSAASGLAAGSRSSGDENARGVLSNVVIQSPNLLVRVDRAKRACRLVFGHSLAYEEYEEPIKEWTVSDVLNEISEESRQLVQEEFSDVLSVSPTVNPTQASGNIG